MWCKECNRETDNEQCELCGKVTAQDIPAEIYWCFECRVPIIKLANKKNRLYELLITVTEFFVMLRNCYILTLQNRVNSKIVYSAS